MGETVGAPVEHRDDEQGVAGVAGDVGGQLAEGGCGSDQRHHRPQQGAAGADQGSTPSRLRRSVNELGRLLLDVGRLVADDLRARVVVFHRCVDHSRYSGTCG